MWWLLFHFLWRSQYACPLCSERNYKEIVSACIQGIQVHVNSHHDRPHSLWMRLFAHSECFFLPFIRWHNVAKMCLCFSEDYLCVAATSEVHRWGVTASSEDQCLCNAGLLAEVWCLYRNRGCYIAHYHQLLLLEKDTQVRVHYLKWYLKQKTNLDQKLFYLLFTLTPSNKIAEVENKAAYCWNDLGLIWSNEHVNKDWWIIDGKVFFPHYC